MPKVQRFLLSDVRPIPTRGSRWDGARQRYHRAYGSVTEPPTDAYGGDRPCARWAWWRSNHALAVHEARAALDTW